MSRIKRCAKSRKTGNLVEYCYDRIGSQNVRDYYREKKRAHRRKKNPLMREYVMRGSPTPALADQDKQLIAKLHSDGWSQIKLAKHFGTTRYRIENALGLR
jgi:hypothetical protein